MKFIIHRISISPKKIKYPPTINLPRIYKKKKKRKKGEKKDRKSEPIRTRHECVQRIY